MEMGALNDPRSRDREGSPVPRWRPAKEAAMTEASPDATPAEFGTGDDAESFPPPNNPETQADQAAGLVEPIFDHHARYETELLTAEFGPPDSDGVYGRSPGAILATPARRDHIEGRSA